MQSKPTRLFADRRADFHIPNVERSTALRSQLPRQYITSGVQDARFVGILSPMITAAQGERISTALAPIVGSSMN